MKKNTILFAALLWVTILRVHSLDGAQRDLEMTGVLEKITSDSLIVDKNGERFEFTFNPQDSNISKSVQVGDLVSISYTMIAKKMTLQKSTQKQLPGEFNPEEHIILDDRVFYDAMNSVTNGTVDSQKHEIFPA